MGRGRLLNEITSLFHAARYRRLREVGQEAQAVSTVAAILDDWGMAIGRNAIIACNPVREAVTRRACTNWFRTVPASDRAKIFIGVARSWRDADGLALVSDPHLRLLAFLALLVQSRDQKSWDDARRSRLLGYRNDPASEVAICAQVFFIADEE
jgi:hypothetical protein